MTPLLIPLKMDAPGLLYDEGPIIPKKMCAVTESTNRKRARGAPSIIPSAIEMEIDTGSPFTFIKKQILEGLGLEDIGWVRTKGLLQNKFIPSSCYQVDLRIFNNTSKNIFVLGSDHMERDGILGRDLLSYGIFNYDGKRGNCYLNMDTIEICPWAKKITFRT